MPNTQYWIYQVFVKYYKKNTKSLEVKSPEDIFRNSVVISETKRSGSLEEQSVITKPQKRRKLFQHTSTKLSHYQHVDTTSANISVTQAARTPMRESWDSSAAICMGISRPVCAPLFDISLGNAFTTIGLLACWVCWLFIFNLHYIGHVIFVLEFYFLDTVA